ncbi:MAG: helix-turn-helix domain-containing protein [Tannerella sp.]|nr:helix-turn-helix domain-containing protein [Tannerella sp.]
MTLALFNGGLSVKEIAEQRHLAVSTIESHLAEFIGKEVAVDKIFTPDELKVISAVIQPFLAQESPSFKAIFELADGKYSYGQLRMAFSYLRQLEQ